MGDQAGGTAVPPGRLARQHHDQFIALGASSTAPGSLNLSRANLGYLYRIRADYYRSTDSSNLNADSAWQYFTVEK